MILLRRGRPVQPAGTSFDIDVTFELGPSPRQRRADCFAPWRPPIEVFETAETLVVRAEIGGVASDDVEVILDGGELRIRGERTMSQPTEHRLYHESRVRYGPFDVRVHMPFPIDLAAAEAAYVDGFLTVTLPRLAATSLAPRQLGGAPDGERGEEKS